MADVVVIDTNVLAVAEGLQEDASAECVAACTKLANQVHRGHLKIAVDSVRTGEAILQEYLRTLKDSPHSGLGSKLAVLLWRQRFNPSVCQIVETTPSTSEDSDFDEVPIALRDFDRDDHKWIAVSVAAPDYTPIFQAWDTEWWKRREDFLREGIAVQFVCASDMIEHAAKV